MARHSLLTVAQAADCLRAGRLIAYPTEAVFGLGCDPDNEKAVRQLLSMKGRDVSAGLILIADEFQRFLPYTGDVGPERLEAAFATWPGHVTWLFPRGGAAPDWVAGAHETVALRVTAHPVCRELCAAYGGAIVSTSANPRSAPPAMSSGQVEEYFGPYLAGIVEGALGEAENPSEIRDLASGAVLRKG
jgi:L-threonylcarbamoyladenylate synthase